MMMMFWVVKKNKILTKFSNNKKKIYIQTAFNLHKKRINIFFYCAN